MNTSTPPTGRGPLGKSEMLLAYSMIIPTLLIVLSIVLLPLLANFWISFKPVQLGDLRAPSVLANERIKPKPEAAGDNTEISYRLRNSSQKGAITDVTLNDELPAGLTLAGDLDNRCELQGNNLSCNLGVYEPGFRETLKIPVTAGQGYIDQPVNPRDTKPQLSGSADNILTNNKFTLDNFRKVFSASEFWTVLRVSLYYTVFGTVGALVFGLFAAQLLSSTFPGRGILRGFFLFPYVAPVIAVAFAWVLLLDAGPGGTLNAILIKIGAVEGPINFLGQRAVPINFFGLTLEFPVALTTVISFEVWRYFPLSFLFILARMQSMSSETYEAAEIDGASPLQQFWYISLPQLAGILAVLFLLRFIWTFNKFDDIFLLTGGAAGTRTLTVDVYEQAFAVSNLGAGAAVAVVVFVVLLLSALLFFKYSPQDDG
jgi:multiple sugar transport system permease protein